MESAKVSSEELEYFKKVCELLHSHVDKDYGPNLSRVKRETTGKYSVITGKYGKYGER